MSREPVGNDQVRHWNDEAGPRWVEHAVALDGQLAPFGERVIEWLAPAPGERVVDVGCGCAAMSLEVARRVGARGEVLGIDISGPMLAHAAVRASGLSQLRFQLGDAQRFPFPEGQLDGALSRFGVMFFDDPAAAFRNLARALRPGGRLVFVAWQALANNPWVARPMAAVAAHLELPSAADPHAPGPFSLASRDRIAELLEGAGFAAIDVADLRIPFRFLAGGGLDDVVDFMAAAGPMAKILREAPAAGARAARAAMREALAPFVTADGVVAPSAAWLVRARKPR